MVSPRALTLFERTTAAADALKAKLGASFAVGWFAEGGLGLLETADAPERSLALRTIDGFAASAAGCFTALSVDGAEILAFHGGALLADGASAQEAVLPIWVMRRLGCTAAIVTGGASALEAGLEVPSILGVEDHLNFTGQSPLRPLPDERLGPRYVDLARAYDPELLACAARAAHAAGIPFSAGVLAATAGPSLETAAERAFLRGAGAHAVGQSIVVPAIAAAHAGLRTLALAGILEGVRPPRAYSDPAAMAEAAANVLECTARLVVAVAREAAEAGESP